MGYATVKLTECHNDVTKLCLQCWGQNCSIREITPMKHVSTMDKPPCPSVETETPWSTANQSDPMVWDIHNRSSPFEWSIVHRSSGEILAFCVCDERHRRILFLLRRTIDEETSIFHCYSDVIDRLYSLGVHHCPSE